MSFADDNFGITETIKEYHSIWITLERSQQIADFFTDCFHEKPVRVTMSRRPLEKNMWGGFYADERVIALHRPCLGTLFHELAHMFTYEHGIKFKLAQHLIYSLFISKLLYTRFEIFKLGTDVANTSANYIANPT